MDRNSSPQKRTAKGLLTRIGLKEDRSIWRGSTIEWIFFASHSQTPARQARTYSFGSPHRQLPGVPDSFVALTR